ncbi:MAG: hypothetical protein V2I34_00190 [Bacteroidales bacterium]|nr:hypothetical protein [Bacteroidales bacterium]
MGIILTNDSHFCFNTPVSADPGVIVSCMPLQMATLLQMETPLQMATLLQMDPPCRGQPSCRRKPSCSRLIGISLNCLIRTF